MRFVLGCLLIVYFLSKVPKVTMSSYDQAKDSAAQKAEQAKGVGQEKAGQAQDATKVTEVKSLSLFLAQPV